MLHLGKTTMVGVFTAQKLVLQQNSLFFVFSLGFGGAEGVGPHYFEV